MNDTKSYCHDTKVSSILKLIPEIVTDVNWALIKTVLLQ